ncbi:MAG TPA: class I SAM-dependent methyltransferase [Tepidisphaeraceae bacterium]|nr:class I SAM-dependent methyltransferase [Tepidisphaeraceae bacterium]
MPTSIDKNCVCPNCASRGMEILYSIEGIPVHSTINLPSREEAMRFPTGNLRLGFCNRCGFLSNTVYDSSVQEYSTQCEESQHFSATFNKFAHDLAKRWIDRYNLRGKTILEVGCGKGDFLALMCELGGCKGIGIDPSYQASRTPSKMAGQLRFINDLYSEKYTNIEADCIMCRHTLEHIGPTLDFVKMIRRAIGNRKDMLVLFELPDATRVLKEAAFWDVYYEHCSYFSPGSLARVFRAAGFDLLELGRDYGDQYLLLAGKPTDAPTQPKLELENDLDEMRRLAAFYKKEAAATINGWRDFILKAKSRGQKTVIWSALSKAVAFLTTMKVGDAIEYGVDINPQRQGRFLPCTGQQIMAPEFLAQYKPDHVILMNPIYVPEVQADLKKMGVNARVVAVGADRPWE